MGLHEMQCKKQKQPGKKAQDLQKMWIQEIKAQEKAQEGLKKLAAKF